MGEPTRSNTEDLPVVTVKCAPLIIPQLGTFDEQQVITQKSTTCHSSTRTDPHEISASDYRQRNRGKRRRLEIEKVLEHAETIAGSSELQTVRDVLLQLIAVTREMYHELAEQRKQDQMSNTLVDAITNLTAEVAEMRSDQLKFLNTRSIPNATPLAPQKREKSSIRNESTNYKAAMTKPSYSSMVARNLVGSRSDTVEVKKPQPQLELNFLPQLPVQKATQETLQRLTTMPKKPEHRQVVILRYNNMAHRKKVNAREWRQILKEKEITPYSILFPHNNTLEFVLPIDQENKMKEFCRTLDRQAEDPNPYARRDGQKTDLPQETIVRLVKNRIQMLKFERSTIGSRYLYQSIQEGMKMITSEMETNLNLELQQVMKEKRLLQNTFDTHLLHDVEEPL